MQTLSEIRQLLAERGIRPKHRLGQNFLHDKNLISKLVDAAGLPSPEGATATDENGTGHLVLEIGPGTGTLTEALLERGAHVIACELDADMAAILRERLGEHPRFHLIEGDCLAKGRTLNPEIARAIGSREFQLIANLPYQAASPLISTLLIDHPNCTGQFITIQREVADRLMAAPGSKEFGPLTVIVQALAQVRRLATLPPECFWPAPEVTSAMVSVVPRISENAAGGDAADQVGDLTPLEREHARQFARFVVEVFTKRRKQLGGIFARRDTWPAELVDIDPSKRPEALSIAQWVRLWRVFGECS